MRVQPTRCLDPKIRGLKFLPLTGEPPKPKSVKTNKGYIPTPLLWPQQRAKLRAASTFTSENVILPRRREVQDDDFPSDTWTRGDEPAIPQEDESAQSARYEAEREIAPRERVESSQASASLQSGTVGGQALRAMPWLVALTLVAVGGCQAMDRFQEQREDSRRYNEMATRERKALREWEKKEIANGAWVVGGGSSAKPKGK